MAETLLFNIPSPSDNKDIPVSVNWYDSINGLEWGLVIDTILISNLEIDPETGKYIWTSLVSDPKKYHQLKTVSINGIESSSGYIIPPRPQPVQDATLSDVYAEKIAQGKDIYSVGETVEFVLDLEEDVANYIGEFIDVFLIDKFGNTITDLKATRVGTSAFSTSWKIPKAIGKLYNINNEYDPSDIYEIKDRWTLPNNSYVEFNFQVNKVVEDPVSDNCEYEVVINGVTSDDGEIAEDIVIKFTSSLTPFYSSVNDVRTVMEDEFSTIGDFDIVRDIMNFSKQVDLHMKPEKIYLQDQYDFAVRMYVRYATAKSKLMFLLAINAESKELDTLKYSKNSSGDPKKSLAYVDELMQKYSYIIYAGGKDTLFVPKIFSKGIYDPNRTEANRAGLDVNDPYPWVNATTVNSVINLNGNMVELRGTRTVAFLKNRASYPNSYSRTEGML